MNKKRVVNFAASAFVMAGLVTAGLTGAHACHNKDLLHKWCPINNYLGAEHQAWIVNRLYKNEDYHAYVSNDGKVTLERTPYLRVDENGNTMIYDPPGSIFNGDKIVTTIETDGIVITKGEEIYSIIEPPKHSR